MKANVRKLIGLAALGMTLLATTVPTWAGRTLAPQVLLYSNQAFHYAYGSMGGARYSADNRQQIGCIAHILSSYSWTTCYATDSAGRSLTCGSGDWKFLEVVYGMTDSSYLTFTADRANGQCSDIWIYNESSYLK